MENKILSILMSLTLVLNACSVPQGEIANQQFLSFWMDCVGGACVGGGDVEATVKPRKPEGGNGNSSSKAGGGTGGGSGNRGGGAGGGGGGGFGSGDSGGSGDGEGDGSEGSSSSGGRYHGGEGSRFDEGSDSSGSMTKEEKEEYRRAAFQRASNEALDKLSTLASEERVPGWFSETTAFLPKEVKVASAPGPLVDPSEVIRDVVTASSESQPSAYAGLEPMGLNNPHFGRPDYHSEHRDELRTLHQRLDMAPAKGPQQYDAKKSAYRVLSETDKAYLSGDDELGDDLLATGRLLVDIATDLIPFTSIPKDFIRAVVGVDPLTGAELTGFERALAAGFFALGVATAGGSNLLKTGIKQVKVLTHITEGELKLAEGFVKVLAKSPLPVEVLIKGTSEVVTLIGRDMARVNEVAAALRKEGVVVNILEDTKFSDDAIKQWENATKGDKWLTPEEVQRTLKFKENQEWIRSAMERGDTILDLGDLSGKPASAFYNMEKSEALRFYKEKVAK